MIHSNADCQISVATDQPRVLELQGIVQAGMEIEIDRHVLDCPYLTSAESQKTF